MKLISILLLFLIGVSDAWADGPLAIPEPLNELIPEIRPGMTAQTLLELLSTRYPKIAAVKRPEGSGFGRLVYLLDDRLALAFPSSGPRRKPLVGHGHFFLFDDHHWTSFLPKDDEVLERDWEPPDLLGGWISPRDAAHFPLFPTYFVEAATLPKWVRERLAKIRVGMKRADAEKLLQLDGGINHPFQGCRYYISMYRLGSYVVMLDLDFQPAAMSDAIYSDPKLRLEWFRAHLEEAADDVLRRVGKPYLSDVAID